jgi:zinc protease
VSKRIFPRAAVCAALCAVLPALAAPAEAAALRMPPVTRSQLKNGLTVLVVPKRNLPLVHLRMVVSAGSVADPPGKEGAAHLCAELLTQGAGARSARQIAEAIEFVGGALAASANSEQCVVTCEALSKDFATGLGLFHDVITAPTFAPEEFDRKREEVLGNIANDRNDPSTIADERFGPFLLGQSPLAHPVIGEEGSVKALTREDVVAFHQRFFVPNNALLAIVGDVHPAGALAAVEEAFKDWRKSEASPAPAYAPVPQVKGRQVLIVEKADVTQTQVRIGCIGVARNHPDYFPIMVGRTILSVGFASRLTDQIRVNKGLTYSIRSRFDMYRNAGTFTITTFTRNETIRELVDATLKEVGNLVDEGPSEDEVARAKRFMTGQFPLQLQAPGALAEHLLNGEFFGLEPQFLETYDAKVNAVTMADVRRALKSYLCTHDLRILVVSDPAKARAALEPFGEVSVKPLQ